MKTNRQWLEQMSDRDLARFLTNGIEVRVIGFALGAIYLSIRQIAQRYTSSALGIEEWLSQEQEYELVKFGREHFTEAVTVVEIDNLVKEMVEGK